MAIRSAEYTLLDLKEPSNLSNNMVPGRICQHKMTQLAHKDSVEKYKLHNKVISLTQHDIWTGVG